jgi:uncharacterized protein YbjT (DUF2867 family)
MKTALVLGSTGLTGSYITQLLLQDAAIQYVITVNRKPSGIHHPKLTEIFSSFEAEKDLAPFASVDVIFSCLGTTRKKTPDLQLYRKIEIDIPVSYAKVALTKNLRGFHFISAVGVKPGSGNFYIQIKSEAEEALKSLHIPHLHIYQPSLLTGQRKEKRLLENIAAACFPLINRLLPKKWMRYHSISAADLARGMVYISHQPEQQHVSYHTYSSIMQFKNS